MGSVYPQKTNIAILQFDAANISEDEVRILTDRLRSELIRLGAFNVVERSVMEEILQEQGFQQTGCVSDECVIEVGKLVGVQQMVAGSIGKLGTIYTISARIIDVETGRILSQKSLDCPCPIETVLTESMAEIAAGLSDITVPKPAEPKPLLGSVSFVSPQDSVRILIDGEFKGYTPLALDGLNANQDYSVSGHKEGFREYSGTVRVEPGEETDISIALERREGQLTVLPSRDGQRFDLTVGYEAFKKIDRKTLNLPEGHHKVMIQEYGYYDLLDTVSIIDAQTHVMLAKNRPILVPVAFKLYPEFSKLTIDSKVLDEKSVKNLRLPFGIYSVLINAPKYQKKMLDFTINNDEPLSFDLRLEPKSKKTTKFLSTILPGSGQLYSGNTIRGLVFMAVTVGLVYSMYDNYGYYQDALAAVDRSRNEYQNATTSSEIDRTWGIYHDDVGWLNRTQSQFVIYGSIMGLNWVMNMIDSYFFNGIPDE